MRILGMLVAAAVVMCAAPAIAGDSDGTKKITIRISADGICVDADGESPATARLKCDALKLLGSCGDCKSKVSLEKCAAGESCDAAVSSCESCECCDGCSCQSNRSAAIRSGIFALKNSIFPVTVRAECSTPGCASKCGATCGAERASKCGGECASDCASKCAAKCGSVCGSSLATDQQAKCDAACGAERASKLGIVCHSRSANREGANCAAGESCGALITQIPAIHPYISTIRPHGAPAIPPQAWIAPAAHHQPVAETPELPAIDGSLIPDNGEIVEYWPNGETKSERTYRNGRAVSAIYYASNGTPVFEMSSED